MRKHIIWSFDKSLLQTLLDESDSYCELFNNLGLNVSKSLIKMLKYRSKIDGLNFEKFIKKNPVRRINIDMNDILIENSLYYNTNNLKQRLLKEGYFEYQCMLCEISEWNGKKLTLQLDHINGISNDNRIDNLRLLCPNCHSQTETYAGKKKKNGGAKKLKILHQCMNCKNEVTNKVFCDTCSDAFAMKKRKVDRPSLDVLLKDIDELGFSATGRKYGVSDNSIRKWVRYYENKV
jgi:5-methylcytosine-specific restriction endonuclease McrA